MADYIWILFLIIPALIIFPIGFWIGKQSSKPKIAGTLIIDKAGETERWSFMMDEDLGEVEKEKFVMLRIDLRE